MFNGSTTASPILFGVYDAGTTNVQEAARISAARNFIIGSTTDAGQKLQVTGTTQITGNTYISGNLGVGTVTPSDKLQVVGNIRSSFIADQTQYSYLGYDGLYSSNTDLYIFAPATKFISFYAGGSEAARIAASRNVLIGTTTDAGQKLQINGSGLIYNSLTVGETNNDAGDNTIRLKNNGPTLFFTRAVIELISGGGLIGHIRTVYGTNAMYVGTTTNSILNLITNNVVRASISNNGVFNLANIPTSAAGLSSGDVWSNLGILNIVP
jgi:hypothetical protein